MRFAYIDSQGREVGIPGVEALQLRIELGAVLETTMFFDGAANKWAPAAEHDIFRTLQREVTRGEGAFLASPPHFPEPPPDAAPATTDDPHTSVLPEPPPPRPAQTGPPDAPMDPDLEDALAELDFDLRLAGSEPARGPDPEPEVRASPLDFGDFAGPEFALEVEPGPGAEGVIDEVGGLELEPRLGDRDLGGSGPGGEALELERAVWEVPEEPTGRGGTAEPGQEAPTGAPGLPSGGGWPSGGVPGGRPASPARPAGQGRQAPRPGTIRRSPPAPAPSRGRFAGPAVLGAAALLLFLLGGGWVGRLLLQDRQPAAAPVARVYEPVDLPSIPARLEPALEGLSALAMEDLAAALEERVLAAGLPSEPPPDWLAGRYLAGASAHPGVPAYFRSLSALLQAVRAEEEALFMDAFEGRMEGAALPEEDRGALRSRARAGFRSALRDRDVAYDRLAEVLGAALGLHQFLLENEANIDHEPAAGGLSRDPVLEAVPLTPRLGDEMWGRVERITVALEAMDALTGRVSTGRLFSLMLASVARTPIH